MNIQQMRVLFFSSGKGSTVSYICSHNNIQDINLCGVVMEDNDATHELETKLLQYNDMKYRLFVNRKMFNNSNEFYDHIYENICNLNIDLIVLAGWMNILTGSFINDMHKLNCKIINLHPTLQYQLIGKDVYQKIWKMYEEGMTRYTGAMVHYVSPIVDRGELILELQLDLSTCSSYDEYHYKMYNSVDGIEKKCLLAAILKLYGESKSKLNEINEITPYSFHKTLKLKYRGKVRDVYESTSFPNLLFVITSDRISANDIVISYVKDKGTILNQINIFWHNVFKQLCKQIVYTTDVNLSVIKKMRAIPLEIIVRRRLYGSLWKEYKAGLREINNYVLPDNMNEGDKFIEPIITPTTKGKKDRPISFQEIADIGILSVHEIKTISEKSLELFKEGEKYMHNLGIEMIDTKFEFGFCDGQIEFIDEIFTPDSSRFVVKGTKMDKDILRKFVTENEESIMKHPTDNFGCRNVILPDAISDKLLHNYKDFYEIISSYKKYEYSDTPFSQLDKNIVIIAGSKSDHEWTTKIMEELKKYNLISFLYYSSAHKNTERTLDILKRFEHKKNVIYITVAGMSNALSGVVSANTSHPVIACPPLTTNDININIQSTLQMPSCVPVATILRPDNVALFCHRMLSNC